MGKIWLKKTVIKYAKQMVYLMCAVLLFLLAYQYKELRIQRELAAKILRFHVIANSNLPEDQAALIYNTIDGGYPILIY